MPCDFITHMLRRNKAYLITNDIITQWWHRWVFHHFTIVAILFIHATLKQPILPVSSLDEAPGCLSALPRLLLLRPKSLLFGSTTSALVCDLSVSCSAPDCFPWVSLSETSVSSAHWLPASRILPCLSRNASFCDCNCLPCVRNFCSSSTYNGLQAPCCDSERRLYVSGRLLLCCLVIHTSIPLVSTSNSVLDLKRP